MAVTPPTDDRPSDRPGPCGIAYKEWAGVCAAVGQGRQTILLRKGGIAESAGRFRPEHGRFWLYPTRLHQAQQGLRDPSPPAEVHPPGLIPIRHLVEVLSASWIDRLDDALALAPRHVWTEETIRSRFAYRSPGLWRLDLRAWARPEPFLLAETAEQSGCKTWVVIDPPIPAEGLVLVGESRDAPAPIGLAPGDRGNP